MRPFRTSAAMVQGLRRCHGVVSSWTGLAKAAPATLPERLEPVRAAMRSLAGALAADRHVRLRYAIEASLDVTGLWHLRITLMQALAATLGERVARERIEALDALFLQVWPAAPVTRA